MACFGRSGHDDAGLSGSALLRVHLASQIVSYAKCSTKTPQEQSHGKELDMNEQALIHGSMATDVFPLMAWEEIVLWHLLPHWGINQAWWKAAKG